MVAVKHCEPDAYGIRICERLLAIYGASLALAQVYVTLNRLERKGLLSSCWSNPKPTRGGRARRCYKLESNGVTALDESTTFRQRSLTSMMEGRDGYPESASTAGILPAVG
jgi:PadR family transcriptional regulator, regulatory protein PadR